MPLFNPMPIRHAIGGRLTLESGVPVSTADQTAKTTVYFTPYAGDGNGDRVLLYDAGGTPQSVEFSEKSIKLTDAQTGTRASTGNGIITALTDTSQLIVGMEASGTGIGVAAVISTIDSATQVTLSVNNTATGTATVTLKVPASVTISTQTGNTSNGSYTISNLASTASLYVGMKVAGTGVGPYASVEKILSGTSVLVNDPSTATGTGVTLTFTTRVVVDITAVASGTSLALRMRKWTHGRLRATNYAINARGGYVIAGAPTELLLGTVGIIDSASGQSEDSVANRLVWNFANRRLRGLYRFTATGFTAVADGAGLYNDAPLVRLQWVVGLSDDQPGMGLAAGIQSVSAGGAFIFPGLDGRRLFVNFGAADASGDAIELGIMGSMLVGFPSPNSLGTFDDLYTTPGYHFLDVYYSSDDASYFNAGLFASVWA